MNLINGIYPLEKLVITKSLRAGYKDPQSIAHKVLADRMGERDPGNKPKPGDRMPFAYRVMPEHMLKDKDNVYKSGPRKGQMRDKKVLQGDRIEDPDLAEGKKIIARMIKPTIYYKDVVLKPGEVEIKTGTKKEK